MYAADGRSLGQGRITHRSAVVTLSISALHQETISFLISTTSKHPLILGNPWLRQHDPVISWHTSEIVQWAELCKINCLIRPTLHVHSSTTLKFRLK